MIKGATGPLTRRISVLNTVDIDVYRAGAIDDVERQVREAAALDIGDWTSRGSSEITANAAKAAGPGHGGPSPRRS